MWERMQQALAGLIGRARVGRVDDSGPVQRLQAEWGPKGALGSLGVKDKVPRLGEYGFSSHPPAGSDAILLFMGGNPTDAVIIATGHQATRIKGLLEGEAHIYNGLTGKSLRMAEDGTAILDCDLIVNGVSFNDLVAAYNEHVHGGVQAGAANSQGPDPTV